MCRQGIEDFRITLRPGVIDDHLSKSPFLAIAHQFAIIAIHQERILRSRPRAFPRHEMLRHHVGVKRRRIVADLDLQIAHGVTRIQRAEQRNEPINDRRPAGQLRKIEAELSTGRPEIQNAVFGQRRRQRIGVAVVETEGEPVQCVRDLISVAGELR